MASTSIAPAGSQTVSASLAARYLAIMVMSTLLSGAVIAGYLQYLYVAGLLPPVPLTGSISFDEKAAFVRDSLRDNFDIIAVGSSMTMNNLSSDVFMQESSRPRRILNIGAWSLKVSDSRRWLNHVLKYVPVQNVILVTGPMDFFAQDSWFGQISDADLDTFMSHGPFYPLLLLHKFSLQNYAHAMSKHRLSRDDYISLQFDDGGAVPFEIYYPKVNAQRWNELMDSTMLRRLSEAQYQELTLMAKDLRSRGVELTVVRALMRSEAEASGGVELERHWERVGRLVADCNQQYLDLSKELNLDDSYFADYSHLNARGASVFSRLVARRLQ